MKTEASASIEREVGVAAAVVVVIVVVMVAVVSGVLTKNFLKATMRVEAYRHILIRRVGSRRKDDGRRRRRRRRQEVGTSKAER